MGACARLNARNASMKALPDRKGNHQTCRRCHRVMPASMKALPDRKGNLILCKTRSHHLEDASMKALPRRKGNSASVVVMVLSPSGLNESPSKKEGK